MSNNRLDIGYERLSRDDDLQGESNSISNQKLMLEEYAERNGFKNLRHFWDDGVTGTTFDRVGFQDMMREVEAGNVATIILKDMSRLGRDYLRVGLYMETMREHGVRLIAINDGVDTLKNDDDFTPFRNIMNEWYARDASRKIKSTFKSKGLSGVPVYHYHLHVAYVPVVDKEIKWSKRCKDKSLVGTTKETVKQVSHSKKWTRDKQYDEKGEVIRNDKGKAILINSYSLLQDRYFEHMKQAGFKDFERGSRGSTSKHLTDLEYKIAKDKERLDGLTEELGEKSERVEKLNSTIQTNEKTLGLMKDKFKVAKTLGTTFSELESMANKNIKGKFELAPNDWRELLNLAKKGVLSDSKLNELMVQVKSIKNDSAIYKRRLDSLIEETKTYNQAKKLNPKKLEKLLDDVIAEGKPKLEQTEIAKAKNRGHELE